MCGRSPIFGGATQYGSNASSAYPGQFNFWADVVPLTPLPFSDCPFKSGFPAMPAVCRSARASFLAPKQPESLLPHIRNSVTAVRYSPATCQRLLMRTVRPLQVVSVINNATKPVVTYFNGACNL